MKPVANTAGKWITGGWNPKFDPTLLKYTEVKGQLGISKEMVPSKIPGLQVIWGLLLHQK